jgi:tetratricopeptide (TPR) repeat protein
MRRRKLLLGSAFSVGAFAEPALYALIVPPAQSTARAGGRRVGMAEVEILTEQIAHLSKLGHQYGSGRVREQVVALLHREANHLLHGSYTEKNGRALLSAVAHATREAGFMSGDVGRHALAQRYYIQALDLAMRAGDRRHGADILQEASRLTVRIGENAPAGQDTLRHGRQAVALARAGLTIADGQATPALAAKLHAVEARGFALLGDPRETRQAVLAAQRSYESVSSEDAAAFYNITGFGDDLGRCLSRIGDTEQALTFSAQALHGCDPGKVRAQCLVQTGLAITHLLDRDLEQAAAFGRDALRTATDLSSTITLERLRTLHRQVTPLRAASPQMLDLDERLTGFLTRTTQDQRHNTTH